MTLQPTRRRGLAGLLVVVLCLSSCGADIQDDPTSPIAPSNGTRVADARFEGEFTVTSIMLDGQDVPLRTLATVDIDTVFGGLTVIPGCNTYFGSFTLTEAGRASFTVAGGSSQDCGDLGPQEDAVLAALGAAERWSETPDGFRFESGGGDSISVSR